MNYYPHHIGDYLKDTAHLTMIEDGAYRRLIDLYYLHENPLPTDKRQVYRLSRATSAAERRSVDTILEEYFTLTDEGWAHTRCEDEIAAAQLKSEESQGKKENEKERQRRHRQRRKELFEALREYEIVPPWDAATTELETLLSQQQSRPVTRDSHADVTDPVTRTATAIHKSITNNHVKTPPTPPGGDGWQKPDWVPADLWKEFEALRRKRKKPMTDRARTLAVAKLQALQDGGHDVKAVMEQSILHAWDTFYPLKTDAAPAGGAEAWSTAI